MALLLLNYLPAAGITVAFLHIENAGANPRYDYLEGIIRGVLQYDLSSATGLDVVNRSDLESLLQEQELRLSSLAEDQGKAIEVGKVLGADYLLKGEYVFLGEEVLVTVSLLDVATARTTTFRERGSGENMIHALSEQIIYRFLGREVQLQSPQRDRSIISLRDETPGTIAFHSYLIDAEIFLDDQFVGYTTGNMREPFLIQEVPPGRHRLRLHLAGFGVVKEPEISFHDWEEEVEVKSGKRQVVRAQIRDFNSILSGLRQLLRAEIDFKAFALEGRNDLNREHELSFVDRQGNSVALSLKIAATAAGDWVDTKATLLYQGEDHHFSLSNREGRKELKETIGKVTLRMRMDRGELDYSLWRADIQQGMFR